MTEWNDDDRVILTEVYDEIDAARAERATPEVITGTGRHTINATFRLTFDAATSIRRAMLIDVQQCRCEACRDNIV